MLGAQQTSPQVPQPRQLPALGQQTRLTHLPHPHPPPPCSGWTSGAANVTALSVSIPFLKFGPKLESCGIVASSPSRKVRVVTRASFNVLQSLQDLIALVSPERTDTVTSDLSPNILGSNLIAEKQGDFQLSHEVTPLVSR